MFSRLGAAPPPSGSPKHSHPSRGSLASVVAPVLFQIGDVCGKGYQIRPHIVWFGEAVPLIEKAMEVCETADILMIIGTSMQVYPAASLMHYIKPNTPIYYVDPKPALAQSDNVHVFSENASTGVLKAIQHFFERLT